MFWFDFRYLIFVAPAILLGLVAQWMVSSAYRAMSQVRARMSGFEAARRVLDANGLYDVAIEQVPGHLSDHYDPSAKVLRLSGDVYNGHSMAAVGIAAHEAGHAIQDAKRYSPLVIRNLAVPLASFGSNFGMLLFMVGIGLAFAGLKFGVGIAWLGLIGFGATLAFQLINLPVEFDASSRAKTQLINLGIISGPELPNVSRVLNAAALTYVAGTLHSLLTLVYYASYLTQGSSNQD